MKKIVLFTMITVVFSGCFLIEIPSKISDSMSRSSDSLAKSSDSSKSVSKSIKSISASISSISTSSSKKQKAEKLNSFKSDIRETTALHMKAGLDDESFRYDMARIALKHGISNWQTESITYLGIGEGLKKAGLDNVMMQNVTEKLNPQVKQLILQGYTSL